MCLSWKDLSGDRDESLIKAMQSGAGNMKVNMFDIKQNRETAKVGDSTILRKKMWIIAQA